MYAMPGHTRENLLLELDFIETFIERHPDCGIMYQPYLYLDPGCEIETEPERFGFNILFRSLSDIASALQRPYWYYSIGYELQGLNRDNIFDAILDVSLAKAKLYHRHKKLSAQNLLKTWESVLLHRRVHEHIKAYPSEEDQELGAFVERTFPAYLRRSNAAIIQRPYVGAIMQDRYDGEAFIYDAFPLLHEVLLSQSLIEPEAFLPAADQFRREILAAPLTLDTATAIERFFATALAANGAKLGFLSELVAFEWAVYCYHYLRLADLPGVTRLRTQHCFDSIDGFVAALGRDGAHTAAPSEPTTYTLTGERVESDSRLGHRRLNLLARKNYCLDKLVAALVQSQCGLDCEQEFVAVD